VQGFFSDCDEAVRIRLRESRAALLIAKNERELVEENRKLKQLESPITYLKDAMYCVNLASNIEKKK